MTGIWTSNNSPTEADQCTAMSKQSGKRCRRRRTPGAAVCVMHGSRTPQAKRAAKVRLLEEQARVDLAKLHPDQAEGPVTDPLEQLALLAGEVLAFKDYLRAEVRKLDAAITYWTERTYDDGSELHTTATEDVRAVVAAYERALDRSTKVLATMVKLDLEGRIVKLREDQAGALVDAIRAGLEEVDMGRTVRLACEAAIAAKLEQLGQRPAIAV